MASSSIEVMGVGGGEVKVMLMDDSVGEDGEVDEELQTIITASADDNGQMVTSVEGQQPANHGDDGFGLEEGEFTTLEGMESPPGTIIFSPQDLLRPSKPSQRGRGRGFLRPGLTNIKQEPHAPPMYGSSGDMEVPVSCEVCGKVMMTGKTLVQHMAIHSDMKPFQCPHCPKSFARKVHLQGHLVVHGIEKQFECPVCHQRFSRQDCVKVHMRLHDKSKCVYCDVCHKAFLTVGALNIHLRIHRGEKPFKCHLCSKCFTQKNHLITHIKRHTKVTDDHFTKKLGPRMFKCEHCPRSFIRLSDYERHVQWNHGAVAEGSIVDKLPTVGSILDGELKQTGLAPQIFKAPKDALNSRPRTRRPKKVMCTTSTQTDEDGGRIIVPRQYQVSAATQVSAPPTPRREDDMYENDIFDEGMDRNYSSDEDEEEGGGGGGLEREDPLEQKVFSLPATAEMASDPIQDAAFDAIVHGREAPRAPVGQAGAVAGQAQAGATAEQDKHSEFLAEVVNSITRQAMVPHPSEDPGAGQPDGAREHSSFGDLPEVRTVPGIGQPVNTSGGVGLDPLDPGSVATPAKEGVVRIKKEPVGVLPIRLLNPPKRGRGRGRGRGRKWSPYGLTGAAELRAIRMNMMKNLLVAEEGKQAEEEAEVEGGERVVVLDEEFGAGAGAGSGLVEEVETEGRGKRLAKNKQHGKDFVCNMKSCETCCPPQARPPRPAAPQAAPVPKVKVGVRQESPRKVLLSNTRPGSIISASASQVDSVHGLLSLSQGHLLKSVKQEQVSSSSGGVAARQAEDAKMKVGNRVGSYPVDITANPLGGAKREDYFVTSSSAAAAVVSPPVELMSFCIPTYSCKLCSREFRFEGKLHRHIESVHQNKAIFSADVKPGRGNARLQRPPGSSSTHQFITGMPAGASMQLEHENPEIAALRSEWDDDEDDDPEPESKARMGGGGGAGEGLEATMGHAPMTIVTRDIAPITTTITDAYSGGVKVNMNKLAGLLPQAGKAIHLAHGNYEDGHARQDGRAGQGGASTIPSASPREPETIMADTLDMKCRRLLEKLFDQDLLLQCGLLEEHVSVVLGKVLQHYGVKMIEDYGQGQYEVLKYNLWRLIEWKVTMEQMEEFYTEGKSVEEMMDDIMHERVPVVSHHFVPRDQAANGTGSAVGGGEATASSQGQPQATTHHLETVDMSDGQVVLQHVAGVLGGQISLPEGVTQVVLSQDMSPDLLQGAHIVTIDPATGQVISQVTADQVILADAIGDDLEQQVSALDGQVVVSQGQLGTMSQGTIVATHPSGMPLQAGQVLVQEAGGTHQVVKMEAVTTTAAHHHHHHHH